jgi:dTMP kinase
MLIVFEGIDGSGKNTQVKKLLSFLKQNSVKYKLHKYPTKKANDAFAHLEGKKEVPALQLAGIFADDIIAEKAKIESESADGYVVICDRYLQSTLAYQGAIESSGGSTARAQLGQGAKADYAAVKSLIEAKDALVPDIVFLLDIPAAEGAKRKAGQKKPDKFESDVAFLAKVRQNYLLMEKEHFLSYKYVVVDASRSPEEIFTEIVTQIEPLLTGKMKR